MINYNSYIEKILENTEQLVCSNKSESNELIENFVKKDELIMEEIQKNEEFFSFSHLRIVFNLNIYSWICILISVLCELKQDLNLNPIEKVLDLFFNSEKNSDYYRKKQELESKSFSLFLDKNKRIDRYIFDFLMTNGFSPISSREFKVYFPNSKETVRESECLSIAKICESSMKNIYFFINSPNGTGKKTFVKRISSLCEKALIVVDLEKCLNSETNFSQIIISALRQSVLFNGFICFDKIDFIDTKKRRLEFIFSTSKNFCKNSFFLQSRKLDFNTEDFENEVLILNYKLKKLNVSQISKIWSENLEKVKSKNLIDINEISNTFQLTPEQIKKASNLIFSEKIMNKNFGKDSIFKCIQSTVQSNFGEMAQIIKNSNNWDDLIIPDNDKQMIIDVCKQRKLRNIVFEDWKIGERVNYGQGLSLLFSGPPGTGKTMAAGIISNEMRLELYRADLSKLISKYIGETEKNLSKLFDEAEKSNSILLFDETDALFSQRTEVKDSKDRGANLEISYLLQRMENHNGICIMTTNYMENIDKAFFRRINYVFHFPKPSKENRKKIWKRIFGKFVPMEEDINFDFLSKFEISGGNIKNIVISACLKAAQDKKKVSMRHILKSLEYELKKQGFSPLKSDFGEYFYLL